MRLLTLLVEQTRRGLIRWDLLSSSTDAQSFSTGGPSSSVVVWKFDHRIDMEIYNASGSKVLEFSTDYSQKKPNTLTQTLSELASLLNDPSLDPIPVLDDLIRNLEDEKPGKE
ncbi:hypothetical protein [Phytohabitans kaempferiae]|uniref:Uncharacterized protein n=1 Tax=Phytohabitans kaempferiae TaxID=1620943 RepID=A0ABV6LYB0_9ACTN